MKSPRKSLRYATTMKASSLLMILAFVKLNPWPIVVVGLSWMLHAPLVSALKRLKSFEVWRFKGQLDAVGRDPEP
jgi:hypothetical protein